jgi:hypothetical protein
MDEGGKKRAAQYVAGVMADQGRDAAWLQAMTGFDNQTIKTFLAGETWPRTTKRQAIESVLQLALGTIERAALGLIEIEPEGDPVERAIRSSRLTRGNTNKLVGIYYEMLDEQDRHRAG